MTPRDERERTDDLFDGFEPAGPPPELRTRVLAAARKRAAAGPIADVWTRIWENRWLRIAWATSVLGLLVGHAALVPLPTAPPGTVATVQPDEEIAELLRPVRIEETAVPALGRDGDDGHPLVTLDEGENPL